MEQSALSNFALYVISSDNGGKIYFFRSSL